MRRLSILTIAALLAAAPLFVRAADDEPELEPLPMDQQSAAEKPQAQDEHKQQQAQEKEKPQQAPKKAAKKPKPPYQPKEPTPIRDASNQTETIVHSYFWLKEQHIVMQKRDFSCGAACLATIARYYWDDKVDEDLFLRALDEVLTDEEIADRIKNGLAMTDLRRAAVLTGYQSAVGRLTFQKLSESKVPLLVGIKPGGHKHFVVYRGTDGMWVYIADPIRGNLRMPIREFVDQWQEKAVLVLHKPGKEVKERSALSLTDADLCFGGTTDQYIRAQAPRMPEVRQTTTP
jgi:predicted double-glycine peptidase